MDFDTNVSNRKLKLRKRFSDVFDIYDYVLPRIEVLLNAAGAPVTGNVFDLMTDDEKKDLAKYIEDKAKEFRQAIT
jgi:hypothetical protein